MRSSKIRGIIKAEVFDNFEAEALIISFIIYRK